MLYHIMQIWYDVVGYYMTWCIGRRGTRTQGRYSGSRSRSTRTTRPRSRRTRASWTANLHHARLALRQVIPLYTYI